MTTGPTVALVFAPDPWVEALHRFFADHGGARVCQLVVDPAVLDDEEFHVLVVGARWSTLTAALVARMHERSVRVVGVFDPRESDDSARLAAVGVDAVVPADAAPAELARVVLEQSSGGGAPADGAPAGGAHPGNRRSGPLVWGDGGAQRPETSCVAVMGAPGAGVTEVGLALAVALAGRAGTLLVDARRVGAGTAVRLGLPLAPNLRTAVDELTGGGDPGDCVLTLARSGLRVLTGFPSAASAGQVDGGEILAVVDALRGTSTFCVVLADTDVGAGLADDAVGVCVTAPNPLGVARTSAVLGALPAPSRLMPPRHVVVNRAGHDRFRLGELRAALSSLPGVATVQALPDDAHVGDAAWDGVVVGDCPFTRAVSVLAASLIGARHGGRRLRRRAGRRDPAAEVLV